MDLDTVRPCVRCGGEFTVRALLESAHRYAPRLGVVGTETPCCGAPEDLAPEPGRVFRGYIYAAGTAHFSREEEYAAPGLEVRAGPTELTFVLGGVTRVVR